MNREVARRRHLIGAGAIVLGLGAALLGGGIAHADATDGGASSGRAAAKHQSATKHRATPKAAAPAIVARTGMGQSRRPPGSTSTGTGPYTGHPPNHALELGLIQLAGYLTMGIPNNGKPPAILTAGLDVTRTEYDGTPVYTLQRRGATSEQAIVALHGGGYVNQITAIQWLGYAILAHDTNAAVVVPVYPLAPAGTASAVVPQTAAIIGQVIASRGADNVSVLGDSAGGGLALAAVQELVRNGAAIPARMVLLSPWLDVTISDPESELINEPATPKDELRHDGLLWAGELDPNDQLVSPINGSLDGLPLTYVYSGSRDYLSPQTLRLRDLAAAADLTNFAFILRNGEIHAWAIYPFLPSAIADRPAIEHQLLGTVRA